MDVDKLFEELNSFLEQATDTKNNKTNNFIYKGDQIESNEPFQAPIKTEYFNSGEYGAGDARHGGKHDGVDLRAPGGTPIYPINDGVVDKVESWDKGGNIAIIFHPNGVRAYYAHMGTVLVKPGQTVDKNTQIGTVGSSGNATNTYPHLHIEVRVNGALTNPANLFYVPKYTDFDKTKEKVWLSDQDKQLAQNFKMKDFKSSVAEITNKLNIKYSII